MKKHRFRLLIAGIVSAILVLSGCSSDGGGDGSPGTGGTETVAPTTVSGKVTLSSVVTAKARQKAFSAEAAKFGKPGSKAYNKAFAKAAAAHTALQTRALPSREAGGAFANGVVYLYDAGHPDWLKPVAIATSDSEGNYELTELANAAANDNAYTDGDPIPAGKYTILAFTLKGLFPDLVALQSVVNEFEGVMSGMDLVAQKSTASPLVTSMLGVSKNTDGTQTWGDEDLIMAPNAAVPVAFSMPMFREAMTSDYLVIEASDGSAIPGGTWTLSADWLTATYYLDEGETWMPGVTYTVTVMGSDGELGVLGAIYNVFGKFLEETGVGTFKIAELAAGETIADLIDNVPPTAILSSPLDQTGVEITTPIRIQSNERMDVNGLLLTAEPSLGAQPGVLYVGKTVDGFGRDAFEYEFVLGEPLKLATSYTIQVVGGTDLAGNEMNALNASFGTVEETEGVITITEDSTAEEIATANAQSDVKDVFGKWVRAFNDRNLPQLQSLMSGDFFMEYNSVDGFDENDINRDSLYDLKEFSEMISQAFVFWDYCEVTITGEVAENINIVGDLADFEFVLAGETVNNSQECVEAAPNESLFATLQKINGAWYMVRASEGIDTRGQVIEQASLLELIQPEDGSSPSFFDETTMTEKDVVFEWAEITDAASYVWIIVDARNSQSGFALILPPTMTMLNIPTDIDSLQEAGTIADVSEDFGFTDPFEPRDGSELYWQVASLGSNTVNDVQNDRQTNLPKDVTAISELYRFKIPGEYQKLEFGVSANGTPVTFSEFIWGFDVGDAAMATVTVTSPRAGVTNGYMFVDGNVHMEYPLTFVNGVATQEIELSQGTNQINVLDGVPCWTNNTCGNGEDDRDYIEEWFQIQTTGGIAPVISIDTVNGVNAAGTGTALTNDGWNFYQSTDAVMIEVIGTVNGAELGGQQFDDLRLDVWNDFASARATRKVDVTWDGSGNGSFATTVEIFQGENWVGVNGHICDNSGTSGPGECQNFNANFGVKTAEGSVYVPPIGDIVMTDTGDTDPTTNVVPQTENWGDGGVWEASAVTGNIVTISGTMEFATDPTGEREPRVNIGSDGGWMDDRLSVDLDGTFSFDVELFHGWNYINIQDVQDNWYHLDVHTDLGKEVIRPEITMVDGAAYAGGDVNTTMCMISIDGTAMEGEVRAYWNGQKQNMDGFNDFYWEEVNTEAVMNETTGKAEFSVTLPLVGSADSTVFVDNFIDIFDQNWNWMGVHVVNTADCDYVPPMMGVDTMTGHKTGATDVVLSKVPDQTYTFEDWETGEMVESGARFAVDVNNPWDPADVESVTVTGTSTVAGREIKAEMWICNRQLKLGKTNAANTADGSGKYPWSMTVDVYPGFNGISFNDGRNWYNADLEVMNDNVLPPPPIAITLADGNGAAVTADEDPFAGTGDPCAGSNPMFTVSTASVTISGTTTGTQDGQGEWWADGSFGRFDIVGGAFSFTVEVYDGWNWINVNDADWNNMSVQIQANNGNQRPQFVKIDSHMHGDTAVPGNIEFTGMIYADPVNKPGTVVGFKPDHISGFFQTCGYESPTSGAMHNCMWIDFSSDPNAADWGAQVVDMGIADANGNIPFSFTASVLYESDSAGSAGSWTMMEVRADGMDPDGMWMGHGHAIELNIGTPDPMCPECGPQERIWKPGAKATGPMGMKANKSIVNKRFRVMQHRGNKH